MKIYTVVMSAGIFVLGALPMRAQEPLPFLFAPQVPQTAQTPQTPQTPQVRAARPVPFGQLSVGPLAAEPAGPPEKVTVPFRNPGQPHKLVVDTNFATSIHIRGYAGQEVIIESTGGGRLRTSATPAPPGMHRIGGTNGRVDVSEENNVMKIGSGLFGRLTQLDIQVPVQTAVSVKTATGREIHIENIAGEIEVDNFNGQIDIANASGSVMAHSMNGKITVSLNNVMPDKPMSFSTMNGQIDVTLPANIKANVKLKTDRGDMFTDFDMQVDSPARETKLEPTTDRSSSYNADRYGRYKVLTDRATTGKINGGGPEIQFTTFNGDILIHKK